jgi:hypothetical protein
LWPGDGTTLDLAGTNHAMLQNGAAFTNGFAGQAFHLDVTNDYEHAPDSDQWAFGTNEFTIELWARFATTAGSRAFLASDSAGKC